MPATKLQQFKWSRKRERAALLLAKGYGPTDVSKDVKVNRTTIYRWLDNPIFYAEVNTLAHMVDISNRGERLRIAMQVVRSRTENQQYPMTKADLLDWLKFAQSETDGVKLDLTAVLAAGASMAGAGSNGAFEAEPEAREVSSRLASTTQRRTSGNHKEPK
jgi:hypothetical protein